MNFLNETQFVFPWENPSVTDNPTILLNKSIVHIGEWCSMHGWENDTMEKIKTWKPELYEKWGNLQDAIDSNFYKFFPDPDTVFNDNKNWPVFFERFIKPYADVCAKIIRESKKIV